MFYVVAVNTPSTKKAVIVFINCIKEAVNLKLVRQTILHKAPFNLQITNSTYSHNRATHRLCEQPRLCASIFACVRLQICLDWLQRTQAQCSCWDDLPNICGLYRRPGLWVCNPYDRNTHKLRSSAMAASFPRGIQWNQRRGRGHEDGVLLSQCRVLVAHVEISIAAAFCCGLTVS